MLCGPHTHWLSSGKVPCKPVRLSHNWLPASYCYRFPYCYILCMGQSYTDMYKAPNRNHRKSSTSNTMQDSNTQLVEPTSTSSPLSISAAWKRPSTQAPTSGLLFIISPTFYILYLTSIHLILISRMILSADKALTLSKTMTFMILFPSGPFPLLPNH